MRIVICFSDPIHYSLAAGERVLNYGKALSDAGAEVQIMMPFSFLAKENIIFEKVGVLDGISYRYSCFLSYHPMKAPNRLIALSKYFFCRYFSVVKYIVDLFRFKSDAILVYNASNITFALIKLFNPRSVLIQEMCEIPFHFEENGYRRKLKRWMRMKILAKFTDLYLVISENLEQYISSINMSYNQIRIPILYDFRDVPQYETNVAKQSFRIVHTGSLTEKKDGILSLLKAISILIAQGEKVELHMTGFKESSPDRIAMEKIISENNLKDCIHFHGYLDKKALCQLQSSADLAVIYKIKNEQNHYNFPSKLAEYMALGVPVLLTPVGELGRFSDGEFVFVADEISVESVSRKIQTVIHNDSLRFNVAERARSYAEQNFHYKKYGLIIMNSIISIRNSKVKWI